MFCQNSTRFVALVFDSCTESFSFVSVRFSLVFIMMAVQAGTLKTLSLEGGGGGGGYEYIQVNYVLK